MKEKQPVHTKQQPHVDRAKRWGQRVANRLARTSLPEIGFVGTFILGRYLKNADFAYPRELIFPLVIFLILGTVTYVAYRLVLRRVLSAHLAALPMAYMLYSFQQFTGSGYRLVRPILPASFETQFGLSLALVILMAVGCGLFGYGVAWLVAHSKTLKNLQLQKVLMFVVLFLFVSQFFKVASYWMHIRHELAFQYNFTAPAQDRSKITGKPDIYYLVFDRYASNETLQNIYDYDNTYLTNFLAEQGFTTNADAIANYPFTMSSISSTLSMDYHTNLGDRFGDDGTQTAFPYRTILNDAPVAQLLKQNGYTYNQVSSWWDFTRIGIHADANPTESFRLNVLNKHFFMSDLQRDFINGSILSPWLKKGLSVGNTVLVKYDLDNNPRQNFENQMTELTRLAKANKTQGPQFSFAHVLVPHDPYVFTADGSEPTYDGNRTDDGIDETEKYTNQLTYLNKRIIELVTTIRTQNPDAAIVIQADEGPYPKEFRFSLSADHYYNPKDLKLPQMKQKMGILGSYYLPGVDEDIVNENIQSSVDPFRFILSHYLGYDLDPLPACHFAAGDKFSLYHYEDLTEKLTGRANAACAKVQ